MCEWVKDKRFFARVRPNLIVDLAKHRGAERVSTVNRFLVRAFLGVFTVALTSCATSPSGPPGTKNTSKTFTTVVVDAGHGGKDNGAFRRYGGAEKLATLDVAKRIERKLRESQLRTVMTRSSDVFISLDERVAMENREKNAIFVSIHFNDSSRRAIHGFETYYHSPMSRDLAVRIQEKLLTIHNSSNRGVRTANFRVLRYAKYPAVLVECGFLSNRREGGEARDSEYRDTLADKIAEAIVEYRYGSGVYASRGNAAPESNPPPAGEVRLPTKSGR